MFLSTILFPYAGLKLWAHIPAKHVSLRSELPYLMAYVAYIIALFYVPLRFLFYMKLHPACSFIITCENVGSKVLTRRVKVVTGREPTFSESKL